MKYGFLYLKLANKSMLHNAVGSMPAQPVEEKEDGITTPVEEKENEIVEPVDDVPSEDDQETGVDTLEDAPEAPEVPENSSEGEDAPTEPTPAPEAEADPNGEEPVVEPINE